jgi:guanine deaminase
MLYGYHSGSKLEGRVGLGTDVSGGFGLGILSAIRDASVVSKTLSFQARLQQRPASPEGSRSGSRTRSVTPKRVANQTSATSPRFADSHLGLDTLYFLATLGGAQVCCLDERIGNLLPGKEFDALLIQTGQKSPDDVKPRLGPENNYDDILDSLPDPYPEGLNPALFIEPDDEIEVVFEKCEFVNRLRG